MVVLQSSLALAAPPADPASGLTADQARAKAQFDAGQAAVEKGDLRRARALFLSSNQTFAATGTLLNLADCEDQLHLDAAALQHFREALAALPPTDKRLAFTKGRIAALEPRVPTLKIVAASGAPSGLRVLLDSRDLPRGRLGQDMPLDPGSYTVTVAAPGHLERNYPVKLTEKQRATLTVEPGAPAAIPPPIEPVPGTVSHSTAAVAGPPPGDPGWGFKVAGSFLVPLGVAAVSMGIAVNLIDGGSYAGASGGSSGSGSSGEPLVRGLLIGAGALTLLGGTTLLIVGATRKPAPVTVSVSPRGAGLSLVGSF